MAQQDEPTSEAVSPEVSPTEHGACVPDEHQVTYAIVEPLCRTPETNITVLTNWNRDRNFRKESMALFSGGHTASQGTRLKGQSVEGGGKGGRGEKWKETRQKQQQHFTSYIYYLRPHSRPSQRLWKTKVGIGAQ